ncbi:hypothetical protein H4Q26_006776 [Puccinia striiformis f. sp. tritici PST-130]|nr:hypothetical protein H4Q26_006776 [Puccinia striiformis f. sp. tritici PST-130]
MIRRGQKCCRASSSNGGDQILFSVTGLGWGGALAALCGLDLGMRNLVHYSHNSGHRAGQSVVANNDYAVQYVPKGVYSHIGQKVRIHGPKSQWYVNCFGNNKIHMPRDGSSAADHTFTSHRSVSAVLRTR